MNDKNKYKSMYLSEVIELIRSCILSEVHETYAAVPETETDDVCPLKNRLAGIFGVTDRIMAALDGDEEGK